MRAHGIAGGLAAIALTLALAGCGAGESPAEPTPSPTATPTSTPTATPPAAELTFVLPPDCASALPESRLTAFEDAGLSLLGGPGGKYGEHYLADPTPEENAGGITCIWGDADTDASSVTVSIAPLGATRPAIVQSLIDQGLNEVIDGDVTLYAQQGDEDVAPAVLNVLRADSWISVIETIGGTDAFDEAITLARGGRDHGLRVGLGLGLELAARLGRALEQRHSRRPKSALASRCSRVSSSWNAVICRPPGASRRALRERHGVSVGGAMSSAPPSTSAAVVAAASSTSNATRMVSGYARLAGRPTSTLSIRRTCAGLDSSSVALGTPRITTFAPPSPSYDSCSGRPSTSR